MIVIEEMFIIFKTEKYEAEENSMIFKKQQKR